MTSPYNPIPIPGPEPSPGLAGVCMICWKRNGHESDCRLYTTPAMRALPVLLASYVELRRNCIAIEELLGAGIEDMPEDDMKRLDKAVTVMKVGFKMVKKVLKSHGVQGLDSWHEPDELKFVEKGEKCEC